VLSFFTETDDNDSSQAKSVLEKLSQFKYIYILYFLADILYLLAMLSKVFQNKSIDDVTTIGNKVHNKVVQIHILFVVESHDLNTTTFNEDIGFHSLCEYDPHRGHLQKLVWNLGEDVLQFWNVEVQAW